MIRKVPVRNVATDENYVMEGELNDFLPNDNTVLIDTRSGRSYDSTDRLQLGQLPSTGLVELPLPHWGKDA